jgi:hypothetical protein
VQSELAGTEFPVPIVDDSGHFQGWATFHVVSADQAGKAITGYFVAGFASQRLTVGGCAAGQCPRYLGSYTLQLVN